MNGIDFIADTNALLYILKKDSCMIPYLNNDFGISVITEMELLSFKALTNEDELVLRRMISFCVEFPLSTDIKKCAIMVRRKYGTKLPDAIVAAMAIENSVPLITADKGFSKIKELKLVLLTPTF